LKPPTIIKVLYFTTIVAGEPEAARRQEIYLAALTAYRPRIEIVRGRFKAKTFRCFAVVADIAVPVIRPASIAPMRKS
jgi:hypothetical protein